jgi:putative chitinase
MNVDRRPIFQAVRQLRRGEGFTLEEVRLLDAAIDRAFAVESAAPPAPPAFNEAAFFDVMRGSKALGPTLSADEVSGCQAIVGACRAAGWGAAWTADALATAVVETAGTMQPIKEIGGAAYFRRMYDIEGNRPAKARELGNLTPGDGVRFAGRGYVQLTGRKNYLKAGTALGHDLAGNPDLAMRPDIAAAVMVKGMEGAWFTGKGLADYLPRSGSGTFAQFKEARRIINGQDRAAEIAGYALEFQRALQAGGM